MQERTFVNSRYQSPPKLVCSPVYSLAFFQESFASSSGLGPAVSGEETLFVS